MTDPADPVKFAKFTEEQEWRMRVRLGDELYEWLEKMTQECKPNDSKSVSKTNQRKPQ